MKYTSIIKRETKVMVLMVVALLGLVLGVSYAMFMDVKDNTNNQIITTGTLQVEYSSNNGYLNGETYKDIIPMSDSEGLEQTGYNFSVKNTGNLKTSYQVYLYINEEEYYQDLEDHKIEEEGLFTEIENIKYNIITNGEPNETVTKISSVYSKTDEETNIKKYLLYTGTLANTNDTNIHSLKLWLDPEDMDESYIGKYVYLKLQVNNYVSGQEDKSPICKRAVELHTEECQQKNEGWYCSSVGYVEENKDTTITYGNLGTKSTLTSGDAFDCDVNGDGIYNADNERFYYVSDYYNTQSKEFEDDTAVLIYYNNVANGEPINNVPSPYGNNNYEGPNLAKLHLPTTEQWKNINLKNMNRAILTEANNSIIGSNYLPTEYSYEGYAARLLTTIEIKNSCSGNIRTKGFFENCNYYLENTAYAIPTAKWAYWMETPNTNEVDEIWSGEIRFSMDAATNSTNVSVRPAIEVPKVEIDY